MSPPPPVDASAAHRQRVARVLDRARADEQG